jgi:hypothetical protein
MICTPGGTFRVGSAMQPDELWGEEASEKYR